VTIVDFFVKIPDGIAENHLKFKRDRLPLICIIAHNYAKAISMRQI